jgi:hypothetical protein
MGQPTKKPRWHLSDPTVITGARMSEKTPEFLLKSCRDAARIERAKGTYFMRFTVEAMKIVKLSPPLGDLT